MEKADVFFTDFKTKIGVSQCAKLQSSEEKSMFLIGWYSNVELLADPALFSRNMSRFPRAAL